MSFSKKRGWGERALSVNLVNHMREKKGSTLFKLQPLTKTRCHLSLATINCPMEQQLILSHGTTIKFTMKWHRIIAYLKRHPERPRLYEEQLGPFKFTTFLQLEFLKMILPQKFHGHTIIPCRSLVQMFPSPCSIDRLGQ